VIHIMRASFLWTVMLFVLIVGGCAVTPVTKQPEPQRPLFQGMISGLSDDVLVTIRISDAFSGREVNRGTRPGNGLWEAVVTSTGVDYIVTAEAEGYISSPLSYTVHISDDIAYVVEGQATTNEALHLDFHFEPISLP